MPEDGCLTKYKKGRGLTKGCLFQLPKFYSTFSKLGNFAQSSQMSAQSHTNAFIQNRYDEISRFQIAAMWSYGIQIRQRMTFDPKFKNTWIEQTEKC
ncbi:hypothetical protein PaeBR_08100 [Paenibacillus sp. BR2-3]|uniref:hypothetical protein n=1 Tax=Paenibacillus sp. BR2-3 TaxID=3048494 RepID=UPI0039772D10